MYNIEIQRASSCNHVKRVRYNASCITVNNLSDGFQAVYVNTAVDDGTVIARLMKHFMEPDFADGNFPEISRRIAELKHNEQEVSAMCKSVQDYADKVAAEVAAESRAEERAEIIENMLCSGMTPEQIAEVCKITLEDVKKVEESLLTFTK